ncbi:alpha,alpha-trehalose-phosphate synthase (UDP-forming) [Duffyella gerundensis]|uniref:alpha,alpha-trehalose-phosphate synthase (UDP-forming) n=1 Tax=Duffyella gerundensis TaxID=1619313 RepID=UPI0016545560|nr:trehalose-6-phosphate synthase [Duffyella gerundensis]
MSGLILVSHNLHQHSTLAAIYTAILSRRGGLWVSWDGEFHIATPDQRRPLTFQQGDKFDTLTFPLTRAEYEEGYHGYVHQGLWPVFHQRPDLARFTHDSRRQYQQLNHAWATAITEYAMPGDVIWVQDYHLIPCIKAVRDAGLLNRIGFFFHQPFPLGLHFEVIPEWQWLAESLLCCDVIGFQTQQDMNNFLSWIDSEFRTERLTANRFMIHGRIISTGVFPLGIDLDEAICLSESNSCAFMAQQCQERLPVNTVLSGGHLDESAGLPYRISAMEVLLHTHPHYAGNVTLLQLAAPAAGHPHHASTLTHQLESLCGEMNGVHGTLEWYPVSCLNHQYSREEQAGIYRASRVGVVTPLVSGMSLMAKMYVALQDPADPGVLVLSRFAGAAEQMDGAILVNPYDPDAIADAIHTALQLSLRERQKRHARLMKGLHRFDCHWWAESMIGRLIDADGHDAQPASGLQRLYVAAPGRVRY